MNVKENRPISLEDIGFAHIDHDRAYRTGISEVIYGQGKRIDQVVEIACRMADRGENVLVTQATSEMFDSVAQKLPEARFNDLGKVITFRQKKSEVLPGKLSIITAGTSDLSVSEEAYETATFFGATVNKISDVGIAGLHRLLSKQAEFIHSDVLIVVAGMEGALPSVVGGLVTAPIIAVPTSVGYGANFSGLAPLLAMMNSCAPGVTVVNIDNGFGAAVAAVKILRGGILNGTR